MTCEPVRICNESHEDFVSRFLEENNYIIVTSGAIAFVLKKYKKLNGTKVAYILRSLGWRRLSLRANDTHAIYVKNQELIEKCLI